KVSSRFFLPRPRKIAADPCSSVERVAWKSETTLDNARACLWRTWVPRYACLRTMDSRSITRYSRSPYTLKETGPLHRRNRDVPSLNVTAPLAHLEVPGGGHLTA